MEDAERDELRAALVALREALARQLASSDAAAQPVDLDEPIGRLSRMDAIQQQHMAKAGLSREQEKLTRVRYALSIIDDPGFGNCEACKKPIGIDRLLFQPEILLCVRCA